MWILGNGRRDVGLLFLPGFLMVALLWVLEPASSAFFIAGFVAFYLLDSGHGYVTAMRVYMRPKAIADHPRWLKLTYLLTPILTFLVAAAWIWAGVPYFWTVVIYTTIFHHARQFFGILRWYQKLNGRFDAWSHRFMYAFLLLPIVMFHGRPDQPFKGHFSGDEVMLLNAPVLYSIFMPVYVAAIVAWLGYEIATWRRGHRELNRIMAVAAPGALSAICFFAGNTEYEVVFPLTVVHAIAYFALIGLSLERTETRRPVGWAMGMVAALLFASTWGALEFMYERAFMIWEYEELTQRFVPGLIIGLYAMVPLSHYALDAVLWRREHPESSQVFAPLNKRPLAKTPVATSLGA